MVEPIFCRCSFQKPPKSHHSPPEGIKELHICKFDGPRVQPWPRVACRHLVKHVSTGKLLAKSWSNIFKNPISGYHRVSSCPQSPDWGLKLQQFIWQFRCKRFHDRSFCGIFLAVGWTIAGSHQKACNKWCPASSLCNPSNDPRRESQRIPKPNNWLFRLSSGNQTWQWKIHCL